MVQLLYVHGGTTFSTRDKYLDWLQSQPSSLDTTQFWPRDFLPNNLDVQCILPRFPLADNAQYEDWKIYFENHLKLMEKNIFLVGWSLGAVFLVKYLAENTIDKNILGVYLIGTPIGDTLDEKLCNGFELPDDISSLENYSVTFFHSRDDFCVPFDHVEKYRALLPRAKYVLFSDRNHFLQEEFPELIEHIQDDLKTYKEQNS